MPKAMSNLESSRGCMEYKHASSSRTQSQQQNKSHIWIFDDGDACRTMMARGDHSLAAASVAER